MQALRCNIRGFGAPSVQHIVNVHGTSLRRTGARSQATSRYTRRSYSVTCSTQAASSSSASNDPHAGHAVLHDFCMTLPYGAIALSTAVVLYFIGVKDLAAPLGAAGVVVFGSSVMSLGQWRQGCQSTPFTLLSGGAAGAAAYMAWTKLQEGVAAWASGITLALSAAAALFCFYNVAAGGNPPKRKA